jgi:hypothetical protein
MIIPIVTGILSLAFVVSMGMAWIRGYWSLVCRLTYSLMALASVVLILFAGYWNMLGWRF